MVNGNSVILQIGEESVWGERADCTEQIKISQEAFKPVYNKVDEGLATGGRGAGMKQTMGIRVDGSFSTLFRPDMGLLLKCLCGVEESVRDNLDGTFTHIFHAIGTSVSDSLPSLTVKVSRIVSNFAYTGCKIGEMSFNAAAADYLKTDVTIAGRLEESGIQMESLRPSARKAFRFAGGKVKIDGEEVADVTSMELSYNNNLDSETQTTDTGDYYKESECGVRNLTTNLEMLYSAGAERIRALLYKTDNTFAIEFVYISDEKCNGVDVLFDSFDSFAQTAKKIADGVKYGEDESEENGIIWEHAGVQYCQKGAESEEIYTFTGDTQTQIECAQTATDILKLVKETTDGKPYTLKIKIPCNQVSEASANMGGLETLKQTLSADAVDNLEDELITFELTNDYSEKY